MLRESKLCLRCFLMLKASFNQAGKMEVALKSFLYGQFKFHLIPKTLVEID